MEDKIYKITLADGTVLDNLKLNGNNFISSTEITMETFMDNCAPVTINDGDVDDVHESMECVQVLPIGSEYWFVLRDLSADELFKIKIQSDVEYLAMMSEIEL